MKVNITDRDALVAVSPAALAAYARAAGWAATEPYGDFAYVYTSEDHPEIIIPQTQRVADYAQIVRLLIEAFAEVSELDQLAIYRDLVTADRDVIRVRVAESNDGSVAVTDGVSLVRGTSEMFLAAACSLQDPRPLYRAGPNSEARQQLGRMRLGQTDQGSFVVTLLTPTISPPVASTLELEDPGRETDPIERQITKRLVGALQAAREAAERTASGNAEAFSDAVDSGVSANLCDAVAMLIEPFSELDVRVVWARTLPIAPTSQVVRFAAGHAPILRQAAKTFQDHDLRFDEQLSGFVQRLNRGKDDEDGTISLRTFVDGAARSVLVVLTQADYEEAIRAHRNRSIATVQGDLEQLGSRWRLLNARVVGVVENQSEGEQEQLAFC